jgi:glycosyltransferase involved in cell wall biosynthesis
MDSSPQSNVARILMLVTNLTFGGAETQVVRLAIDFKARGYEVCVVSMMTPETWVQQLVAAGVKVETLGMARGSADPRAILRLRKLIKQFQPDAVHCHMFHANLLGRITRIFCPMPALICTVHNLRETSERGGGTAWKEALYRVTDFLATRTTIICKAAFDRYVKVRAVPRFRLEVVPNGIDTKAFRPSAELRQASRRALGVENRFVWLAVGRLVKQKDYPNLIKAVARLSELDFVVLVAGNGPLEEELRSDCANRGLSDKIQFMGAREDIRNLYAAADAYVMSSEFEGFSMALLEAAAMELPVVATDAGGNREIVVDGVTGYIVPTMNPLQLASKMRNLMLASDQTRMQMGIEARAFCSTHFEANIIASNWLSLYTNCLQKSGTASASVLVFPRSR